MDYIIATIRVATYVYGNYIIARQCLYTELALVFRYLAILLKVPALLEYGWITRKYYTLRINNY